MQLEAAVDHAVGDLGAEQLRGSGLGGGQLAASSASSARSATASAASTCLAGGQLELGVLERGDRLAEDRAVGHVLLGEPDGGLGLGVRAERDAPALGRRVLAEVVEALVLLAEQVLDRHLDVDEGQLGGVGGAQANLSSLRPTE
nr:hypothetical protein [Streptomyces sp. SJL17-1]